MGACFDGLILILSFSVPVPYLCKAFPCLCQLNFLQPYRISFGTPEYGGIYHQCVFMLCRQDGPTMNAGKQSKEMFSTDASTAYMPHLSLLYSDIDEHIRQVCLQPNSSADKDKLLLAS